LIFSILLYVVGGENLMAPDFYNH